MHSHYGQSETHHADMALPVHDRISDLNRRAYALGQAVADSAMDSGCTDAAGTYRASYQALGPRQRKAWDMIAEAYGWNAISDQPAELAEAERCEREGIAYVVGYRSYTEADAQGSFGGYGVTIVAEDPADEPQPVAPGLTSNPRPFSGGQPRCTTCHRANHRPGEWQGHNFTSNPQLNADDPGAQPGTGREYYVILTGYAAPASRPSARFGYVHGGAGQAFADAVTFAAQLAGADGLDRTYDVYHATAEGQQRIVSVKHGGDLIWPRH